MGNERRLVGIERNDTVRLHLLRNEFPKFCPEYNQLRTEPTDGPVRFYLKKGLLDGVDALAACSMIRSTPIAHPRSLAVFVHGWRPKLSRKMEALISAVVTIKMVIR